MEFVNFGYSVWFVYVGFVISILVLVMSLVGNGCVMLLMICWS